MLPHESPPSPARRSALTVAVVLLAGAAAWIATARLVGAVDVIEISFDREESGWTVRPDPRAATVTATPRPDTLDITFQAPASQGEDLYTELTFPGGSRSLLPGAPILAGANQVTVGPAPGFRRVVLRNYLARLERPALVVVRGGPPDPAHQPARADTLLWASLAAAVALAVRGLAGPGRTVVLCGALVVVAAGVSVVNDLGPYRVFLSPEAASSAAGAGALVTLLVALARDGKAGR